MADPEYDENSSCLNGYRWENKNKICLPYKKCEKEKEFNENLGYKSSPSKIWDPYKKKCIKTQYESDCKDDEVYNIPDYLCEKKSICKNGK